MLLEITNVIQKLHKNQLMAGVQLGFDMSNSSDKKLRKQPRNWHPEDIKAAIRKTGITMTDLETQKGISHSSVRVALIRPQLSGEKAISEYLKIPLHNLWPERWTANGDRIRPRHAHKYNTRQAELS